LADKVGFELPSYEDWLWACGILSTRACYMLLSSIKGDNNTLVPFADFLNHADVQVLNAD